MNALKRIFFGRLNYFQILLWVMAVISVRVFAEWKVFVFSVYMDVVQDYLRFYLENMYYFLILFLVGSVVLELLTRQGLKRIMNFCARLYLVIIIPPLIDGLLLNHRQGYEYCQLENLWVNFCTLSGGADGPLGIFIEVLIGVLAAGAYVFVKTRSFLKACAAVAILDVFLLVLSTPDIFFGAGRGDYFYDNFLPLFYYFPFIVLLGAALFIYDRKKLSALLANIRLVRSAAFVFAVALGGIFTLRAAGMVNLWNLAMGACAIFFVWQTSVIVNDLSDRQIDAVSNPSRPLSVRVFEPQEYMLVGFIFAFLALSFAAIINLQVLLFVSLGLGLALAYSVPPLRLRRNLWGLPAIGGAVVVSFFTGIASSYPFVRFGAVMRSPYALRYTVFLFLVGTLIPLIKDIKDIAGDTAAGVRNLFTLYGKKRGTALTCGLVFCAFNVGHLVLGRFDALILILSALACWLCARRESIKGVYILAMAVTLWVTVGMGGR